VNHKYYIAQATTPPESITINNTRPTSYVDVNVIFGIIAGIAGAIGLPKLVNSWGSEKIEGVKSERRREDTVYNTLFSSMDSMLKTMTGMINTMSAGQSSSTSESFQLMASLVQEISLMREVVSNNTQVMEQVRDMNEALTQEIHEMRVAGTELREEVSNLKQEVSTLTRRT
jgi:hypothetical protein